MKTILAILCLSALLTPHVSSAGSGGVIIGRADVTSQPDSSLERDVLRIEMDDFRRIRARLDVEDVVKVPSLEIDVFKDLGLIRTLDGLNLVIGLDSRK